MRAQPPPSPDTPRGEAAANLSRDAPWQQARAMLQRRLQQELAEQAPQLGPDLARSYSDSLGRLFDACTETALRLLSSHVRHVQFYVDVDALTAHLGPAFGLHPGQRLGGLFDRSGVLHLNGAGRDHPQTAIYAHELGHVLDGTGRVFSSGSAWRQAWEQEVRDYLSHIGSRNPAEGFAEFGRFVLMEASL